MLSITQVKLINEKSKNYYCGNSDGLRRSKERCDENLPRFLLTKIDEIDGRFKYKGSHTYMKMNKTKKVCELFRYDSLTIFHDCCW